MLNFVRGVHGIVADTSSVVSSGKIVRIATVIPLAISYSRKLVIYRSMNHLVFLRLLVAIKDCLGVRGCQADTLLQAK
jgi:hypothetical protein